MDDTLNRIKTSYITVKNYNRGMLFYELADYQNCLTYMNKYMNRNGLQLHAYALMPDHIYLLLSYPHTGMVLMTLDMLELEYGEYFNFYHRRERKVLELDSTFLPVVADQYLLMYYRHIELAPVRAGLAGHPSDYHWSSYGCNALGEDTGMLVPHATYTALGADAQQCRTCYRQTFDENLTADGHDRRAIA